jgi:hypothetical protein
MEVLAPIPTLDVASHLELPNRPDTKLPSRTFSYTHHPRQTSEQLPPACPNVRIRATARRPGTTALGRELKPGIPGRLVRHEARMTRAAFAAGVPAPEVFDEVTLEGRFGIVLARLDGPTLQQLLRTRAMASERVGSILTTLYLSVHKTPPPPGVISLREMFDYGYRHPGVLPEHIAPGILTLIERLPPGTRCAITTFTPAT